MFKKLFASTSLRVGLAIVVILAVVFSISPGTRDRRPGAEPVPRTTGSGRPR